MDASGATSGSDYRRRGWRGVDVRAPEAAGSSQSSRSPLRPPWWRSWPCRSSPRTISGPASGRRRRGQVLRSRAGRAAADFRDGQRNLFLVGLAIELLALGALAFGRPRRVRDLLERLGARPILGAAAAGAGISLLLALLAIPTGLVGHGRAVDVGLSTQDLGGWFFDRARSAAIGALLAAIGAMILIALQRRLPRLWWMAGTGIVIAYAIVSTWLAPVVLAPIFNDFEPLPDGPARQTRSSSSPTGPGSTSATCMSSTPRAAVRASTLTSTASVPVRRVVLYDNLLDRRRRPTGSDIGRGRARARTTSSHDDLGLGTVLRRDHRSTRDAPRRYWGDRPGTSLRGRRPGTPAGAAGLSPS